MNWFQSSVGINTAGHCRTARAGYNTFTLLDSFFLSFFSILEIWFMDLNSCFWGRLAHSRHCPFSCHVQVGSTMVLKAHGAFQWISHFLLHWSRKFALGYMEESFELLPRGTETACHFIQMTLKTSSRGSHGLWLHLWDFDGQEL